MSPYIIPGLRPMAEKDRIRIRKKVEHTSKELIQNVIESYYKLPKGIMQKKTRKREACTARHLFCHIAYHKFAGTTTSLGRFLNRDHTTVLNSMRFINDAFDIKDEAIMRDYARIEKILNERNYNTEADEESAGILQPMGEGKG